MSNSLVPGFVPKGWTRGEELTVHQAPRGGRGYVEQAPLCSISDGSDPCDAFYITFHHDDADQVQAWLDWWRS